MLDVWTKPAEGVPARKPDDHLKKAGQASKLSDTARGWLALAHVAQTSPQRDDKDFDPVKVLNENCRLYGLKQGGRDHKSWVEDDSDSSNYGQLKLWVEDETSPAGTRTMAELDAEIGYTFLVRARLASITLTKSPGDDCFARYRSITSSCPNHPRSKAS